MAKEGKKRVSITVNTERFDRVSSMLDQEGFPRGYLSFYLDGCIEDLESVLIGEPTNGNTALDEVLIEKHTRKLENR
jgi:hypothetical protein